MWVCGGTEHSGQAHIQDTECHGVKVIDIRARHPWKRSRHPETSLDCQITKFQINDNKDCFVLSSVPRFVFVWPSRWVPPSKVQPQEASRAGQVFCGAYISLFEYKPIGGEGDGVMERKGDTRWAKRDRMFAVNIRAQHSHSGCALNTPLHKQRLPLHHGR
jgi:hypothetical protein